MAHVAKEHKGRLDWFDCWDIGKLFTTLAYRDGDMPRFYSGRDMVEEALHMHIEEEPEDLVMRAKVHDSLAECYLVVKEYEGAEEHFAAAYNLMLTTLGRMSPLFGRQARHSAELMIAQGKHEEALPFLGEALTVEAAKDAPSVRDLTEVVDLLVESQQRSSTEAARWQTSSHRALRTLRKNLKARGMVDSPDFGILCHKMSLIYMHEYGRDPKGMRRARRLAKRSVRVLRNARGEKGVDEWLQMVEMHFRMLSSAAGRAAR
eukprot:NODE_634_length_1434_cov_316.635968.p2 GENE.NODE_634_length_1434_cov_316.635968~~NODE_634_length_1434_cov_316.635968.p2  ORF type:complete len:262 (-),score=106.17 NODE_634_length_1434_cov_316.635968:162-947(-)